MNCEQLSERLTDLLEGDLDSDEETAALEHLATCAACELVLAETRDVIGLARDHGRVTLSTDDQDRLWSRVIGETSAEPGQPSDD